MDIPRFLDLAIELEMRISTLYGTIADRSGDEPIAARLKTLANEEFNHANAIRRGKRYYEEMPDEFSGIMMDTREPSLGLEEIKAFQATFEEGNPPLPDQLKKMLDFERRFEKIYMGALVKIKDTTLKRLFITLTKSDQSHTLTLLGLIESLGVNIQDL